ncbi:hypothetical protein Spla01_05009 [Streptomyces platensis]|uniref:Uncharacterized protein n=1 Tax=Streptomyces platensis TaxID=58346 RepID=A0ABX3XWA5_STRPT|nr:hypothetical protein BG653_03846 [Streptomyces platensis]
MPPIRTRNGDVSDFPWCPAGAAPHVPKAFAEGATLTGVKD